MRNLRFITVCLATLLVACSGGASNDNDDTSANASADADATEPEAAEDEQSATLVVTGSLGDRNFWDQADAGFQRGLEATDVTGQLVETGPEASRWEPALQDAAGGDSGLVLAGSFAVKEMVERIAGGHPETAFVLFDVEADLEACGCENIYSMTYDYLEAGYLAGYLAASMTTLETERTDSSDATIGFVGGMDIPVIRDYLTGYEAGAAAVDSSVRVLSAFAGDFGDPVAGKQRAQEMISQGADVVFAVAGGTNLGVFEAADEGGVWAIGVAATEAEELVEQYNGSVLTASFVDIAASIADAIELYDQGSLPLGEVRTFGVADESIRLVESMTYLEHVPSDLQEELAGVAEAIAQGEVKVQP